MADDAPPSKQPTEDERYRLSQRLEAETKRITGVAREHFVDQKSLCASCKHASIQRQGSRNTRMIYCTSFAQRVPEDILECTEYAEFGSLSLGQMTDIATLIDDRPDRYQGYL